MTYVIHHVLLKNTTYN